MSTENNIVIIVLPGVIAMMLLGVFSFLYSQSRQAYFRAWQAGWAAYAASYVLLAIYFFGAQTLAPLLAAKLFFAITILSILVSTRLVTESFRWRRQDLVLAIAFAAWITWAARFSIHSKSAVLSIAGVSIPAEPAIGFFVILVYSALKFIKLGRERQSAAFKLLASALIFWACLLLSRQIHTLFTKSFETYGHLLGPLPQMLIAISMLMVLYENERRSVQENLIAFSTLEVDFSRVLSPAELQPSMNKVLQKLCTLTQTEQMAFYAMEPFRNVLPSAQSGLPENFLQRLESEVGESVDSLLRIKSSNDVAAVHNLSISVLRTQADQRLVSFSEILKEQKIAAITVLAIRTRDRALGLLLLPHADASSLGASQASLVTSLAMQLATTLEKYALLHEAQRRTKEFELLTEIGQVVSSRLDQDEVLSAIHKELGQLFDTDTFYVAFQEDKKILFEFEFERGVHLPKRTRPITNGFTEHIMRTGQPLLIEGDLERVRDQLGVRVIDRPAKCFCGVPIFRCDKAVGVMVVMHYGREGVYSQRDLEMLQTAARQVAVATENARLFAQEQKRARYLAFLNGVSKIAISSQDAEKMLAEIVEQIEQNFNFDHIGVGIVDYNTKEIEIKAEAGSTDMAVGKRIPLGVGIMGRVARSSEMVLEQGNPDHLLGIIPGSRSVLCLPIAYGESLLGLLNVESSRENAFQSEEVLIMQTLADLLATALHNVFVFQKMEQQSITDPLTGIKTRRYFNEALQSESKRAMRSGRPFSVVIIDLDKFKEVNDTMGHLEGDLVLARIGRLLDQKVRQSNVVARYGGDEFVVLMPETGVEQASILSERLRLWIATDPMLNERHVTGSFGVAEFPLHGSNVEEIIRVADASMYKAKHAGGNKVFSMEPTLDAEALGQHRQLIHSHLESILRREHVPNANEVLDALEKISEAVAEKDRQSILMDAVRSVTRALESRELHATGHGETVASYVRAIGDELALPEADLSELIFAAQVHDVGKIILHERLLNKPTALNFDEYQLVKSHSAVGADILAAVSGTDQAQKFVLHHQERFDGGGYPNGLKGEQIPLGARIIAVAEAYVNMTTDRAYADAKTPVEAMLDLERSSGTQFDGMIVRILIKQLKSEKTARA
ncbi:MAG: diguanylate cyclase with sensor [Acidobacteriaceae bacterium]|nr:diguanylate cyclase with sensor [Acidobacteriaceae bacterium]